MSTQKDMMYDEGSQVDIALFYWVKWQTGPTALDHGAAFGLCLLSPAGR